MKSKFILFAGLLAAPTLAFADLGDTPASSEAKYGKGERHENEHELRYFTMAIVSTKRTTPMVSVLK